jgi:copper chaperone CopZ
MPEELESKSVSELDPLNFPIEHDARLANTKKETKNKPPEGSKLYPYEPLPRSGLGHPYVQAILNPWLGPEADQDAIQLGLTTLRTWWQHRRKGESGTAAAALSTEKMKGVVEGYTRHFFNLAYCLVLNDKEQPPRTLNTKMKELEKARSKNNKKRARDEESSNLASLVYNTGIEYPAPEMESNLTPLERLHAAQRRQLAESGGVRTGVMGVDDITSVPLVDMKGKCVPGKLNLPAIVDSVNHRATQLAHRGGIVPNSVRSAANEYGDPNTTPVVFVSYNGDIQIAMAVDGITCAHCVKIVETVLKGCSGNKSPIDGLLDAAADRVLCQVIIKIDKSSNAKRIAFEAARNLSMVGYTAKAKEMSIVNADSGGDKKATMDLGALSTAFEVVATTDPQDVFDWNTPCSCPDNGILRDDCERHSQMNTRIFDAFNVREQQVKDYMAGCGKKYGMPCTCGPDCRCTNCEEHCRPKPQQQDIQPLPIYPGPSEQQMVPPIAMEGLFGSITANTDPEHIVARPRHSMASRNPSILSFGGVLKRMSLASEANFGRAMSGLSALSIDWENMEDFDVNVDHSAHITYDKGTASKGVPPEDTDGIASHCNMMKGETCNCGPDCICEGCPIHDASTPPQQQSPNNGVQMSNLRKSVAAGRDAQVTFKV